MMGSKLEKIIIGLTEASFNQGALGAYEEMRMAIRIYGIACAADFVEKRISELTELTEKTGSPADILDWKE